MNENKTQIFIEKATKIHGHKIDYSLVNYTSAKNKVKVICEEHGIFLITPNNHLSGHGCPKCSGRGFTPDEQLKNFIQEATQIHKEKYDYSLVNIEDKKFTILCKTHGEFKQSKITHITNKCGCPKCGKESTKNKTMLTKEKFIEKASIIHGDSYDYSQTVYLGAHIKVNILCSKHGEFSVTPANHWSRGVGCPKCMKSNASKGEVKVGDWLTKNGIYFETQKSFKDLFYTTKKAKLKFDFFIPSENLLIEFDGEYHYIPITFNKNITAEEQFALTRERDKLKTEYAEKQGYRLLRIRFDDDVSEKLQTALN